MTTPDPGVLAALTEAERRGLERLLEQVMGCHRGDESQELDADLRPTTPVYAMCTSGAHDHAYYDRFCGFANNLAAHMVIEFERLLSERAPVVAARERAAVADWGRLVRAAIELTAQDVRAQRGDHIASLVEESFEAHMNRAARIREGNQP